MIPNYISDPLITGQISYYFPIFNFKLEQTTETVNRGLLTSDNFFLQDINHLNLTYTTN